VQLLYLGKLSRLWFSLKISICQSSMVIGERKLLSELPNKGWKLESIDSLLNKSHKSDKTGTIFPQPGSGRPRLSRSSEWPCAQSGGQAKKAPVSSLDFAWNCHSLFKCIQKNNSPWSPAHMLQMMCMLSCCLKPISPVSLTNKQRYRLQ